MQKLDLYTWKFLKLPIIIFWLLLSLISSCSYIGFITWDKTVQLESRLEVAGNTVSTSLKATDWDLALDHMRSIAKTSNTYNIELSQGQHSTVVGPLGTVPFGIGHICRTFSASKNLSLSGCTRLVSRNELVTVGILALSQIIFLLAALFFLRLRTKMFMGKISSELEALKQLQVSTSVLLDASNNSSELSEVKEVREKIVSLIQHVEQYSCEATFAQVASQVVHDVRSPLAALNLAVASSSEIPEAKRILIREAVSRIRDVTNILVGKNQALASKPSASSSLIATTSISKPSIELISCLIEPLVSEKRIQHSDRSHLEIDAVLEQEAYGLFSNVNPAEFKRVLSNLIDNAVQAISDAGKVTIRLKRDLQNLVVSIEDTGKGIPKDILPKLMRRGATFGKEKGWGLGLYHAKTMVQNWSGTIEIRSEENVGTTVFLTLPLELPPQWFVPNIQIKDQMNVVVLDDDRSIHCVWDDRFQQLPVKMCHFYKTTDLKEWVKNSPKTTHNLFLVDYELIGQKETGLELIEELNISEKSILVSSRFESVGIRNKCKVLGVRLIPKGLAGFVPVKVSL